MPKANFIALVLRKELDRVLEKAGYRFEWEDIKRDLKALQETTIEDAALIAQKAVGLIGKFPGEG